MQVLEPQVECVSHFSLNDARFEGVFYLGTLALRFGKLRWSFVQLVMDRRCRMLKKFLGIAMVVALAGTVAWADDFWDEKNFLEWNNKELRKMTTDSPWAKKAQVKVSRGGDFSLVPSSASASSRDMTDVGSGGGGSFGRSGGTPRIDLFVMWRSARPLKKAIVKSLVGNSNDVSAAQQEFLDREEEYYIVVLGSVPPDFARAFENLEGVDEKISLDRKGKDKIFIQEIQVQAMAGEVHLLFPKTDAIVVEDKDVELNVDMDGLRFKKKFSLKNMVVNGKLEM